MLHEQDGEAILVLDEANELHELHLLGWVHAGGGLIQQQQLRSCGEGADDFEAALVAVGQALGRCVGELAELENLQHVHDLRGDLLLFVAEDRSARERMHHAADDVQVKGDADVVEDRQRREQPDVLKGPCDAVLRDVVGGQAVNVAPTKRNRPLGRLVNPGDEVEDGGLARAVGPDEAEELLGLNLKVQRVDRREPAEPDRALAHVEQRSGMGGGGHYFRAKLDTKAGRLVESANQASC